MLNGVHKVQQRLVVGLEPKLGGRDPGKSERVARHANSCVAVLQVPYRLLKAFHKVQQRLVRELEKKFSGKDVVLIANRRVMPTPSSGKSIARPRSRTLTAVRLLPILGHAASHSVKWSSHGCPEEALLALSLDIPVSTCSVAVLCCAA